MKPSTTARVRRDRGGKAISVSEVDVALIDDFLISTMTRAAEPLRTDFECREPRCRICRDETVRVLVNKLLDWHGAPIILGRRKTHVVTYPEYPA
jgi:hypothetical protein